MAKQRRSVEKERYWRRMVGEQAVSGQSIRAFCRERQLSEPSVLCVAAGVEAAGRGTRRQAVRRDAGRRQTD